MCRTSTEPTPKIHVYPFCVYMLPNTGTASEAWTWGRNRSHCQILSFGAPWIYIPYIPLKLRCVFITGPFIYLCLLLHIFSSKIMLRCFVEESLLAVSVKEKNPKFKIMYWLFNFSATFMGRKGPQSRRHSKLSLIYAKPEVDSGHHFSDWYMAMVIKISHIYHIIKQFYGAYFFSEWLFGFRLE